MERLPNELLYFALSFLPKTDLKKMRRVNKFFSDFCIDLLFPSEAHLILTSQSTQRLVSMSYHPRISHVVTSLLYEVTPLEKFEEEEWRAYVRDADISSEDSQPRDPNRPLSLKDSYANPRAQCFNAITKEGLSAGWAAYYTMRAWQEERGLDDAENQDIHQAIQRFPRLKSIKIYIGPLTKYSQRSFATTLLAFKRPKPIQTLSLPPLGLRTALREFLAHKSGDEAMSMLARVRILYLDEIAVTAISLDTPLVSQIYPSLQWLEELRITMDPARNKDALHIQALQAALRRGDLQKFLCQAPNLRTLDIGYTHMYPCDIWWEYDDVSCALGQSIWPRLDTVILRGWPISASHMLSFVSRHSESLRSLTIDCATLLSTYVDPWAKFIESLRGVKLWANVELWGELIDLKENRHWNRYILGWPPEFATVKDDSSFFSKYTIEPFYHKSAKARQQIQQYTQRKTDLNPFAEGGAAHACAEYQNGEFVGESLDGISEVGYQGSQT